ncbi:MAG: hypothetical protein V4482_03745 [Pseudomonadota bacterium]
MKKNKINLGLALLLSTISSGLHNSVCAGEIDTFVRESQRANAGSGGVNAPKAVALLKLVSRFEVAGDHGRSSALNTVIAPKLDQEITTFIRESEMARAGAGGVDVEKAVALLNLVSRFEVAGDHGRSSVLNEALALRLEREVNAFIRESEMARAGVGGINVEKAVALLKLVRHFEVAGSNALSTRLNAAIQSKLTLEVNDFINESRMARGHVGGFDPIRADGLLKLVLKFEVAGNNELSTRLITSIKLNLAREINEFVTESRMANAGSGGVNAQKAIALLDLTNHFEVAGSHELSDALKAAIAPRL